MSRPHAGSRVPPASLRALAVLVLLWLPRAATAQDEIHLGPGFVPDPRSLAGTAGGPNDASVHGISPLGPCVGWIPSTPNHVLTLDEHFEFLSLAVHSGGDTTLVVEGPVGWWCNDDSEGLNPGLFGQWAPGTYRVFVGTYQTGQSWPYTLTLTARQETPAEPFAVVPSPPATAIPSAPPPLGPAPPIHPAVPVTPPVGPAGLDLSSTTPNFDSLSLASGFAPDPQSLPGTSGGPVAADPIGTSASGPCRGQVSASPDHLLTLSTPLEYLRFDVLSGGDTTLLIHGPNGWRCSDDAVGLNPRIGGNWPAGTYRIWVGSYNPGQFHPYTLQLSATYP